jgi:hypothetical protein
VDCETIAGAQPVRLFGMRLQSQNANVEGLQPSKVMRRYGDMMKLFESEHASFSQSIRLMLLLASEGGGIRLNSRPTAAALNYRSRVAFLHQHGQSPSGVRLPPEGSDVGG